MRERRKRTPEERAVIESLRRLRAERLQKDVVAGIATNRWLSGVEKGLIDPPLSKLVALARALGATVALIPSEDARARVVQAIRDDHTISPDSQRVLLATYDAMRAPDTRPKKVAAARSSA